MKIKKSVSQRLRVSALAILAVFALATCAKNPVTGKRDFVLMSEEQEIKMGQQADPEVKKEYGTYDRAALQAYVDEIGQRLAKQSHRTNIKYQFTVVDSAEINAFALPGGYIYITRGIMAYLNSEAEVAGVIGHEIGHVTARHGVQQQSMSQVAGLGVLLGAVLVPGLRNESAMGMMQQLSVAWIRGYGREDELEADRLGAEYLARAGYDPQAMIKVVGVLKNQELFDAELAKQEGREPRKYHGVFESHPDNDTRLKQVIEAAKQYKTGATRGENHEGFLRVMNGVTYGDSPQQGITRGTRFFHEGLGLALKFPDGWKVQNSADRVAAINPTGDAIVELHALPADQKGNPADTVKGLLKLDRVSSINSLNVNGLPATVVTGTQKDVPVRAAHIMLKGVPFLVMGYGKGADVYQKNVPNIDAVIKSFHAITDAERAEAKPYEIRTIVAPSGTTFAQLAKSIPQLGRNAEQQLRLMNGKYPTGEPQAGELIKVIQTLSGGVSAGLSLDRLGG
jgi:predicted Zn-dependent protease